MSDLFLFLDESGDFTFNPQASKYLVFTCLSTTQPDAIAHPLAALRYQLFSEGVPVERFHAAEDKQVVRDRVFALLSQDATYEVDAVVVEKRKTHPSLREYGIYSRIYSILLRYVLKRRDLSVASGLHIICDTVPLMRKRKAMEGALKTEVAALARGLSKPHFVVFQASASHPYLQAADYCGWAIFRNWERKDIRSFALIKPRVKSVFNVFAVGTTYYY
jgi:hypothetical protein